MQKKPRKWDNQ